jgi:hypothetical protein
VAGLIVASGIAVAVGACGSESEGSKIAAGGSSGTGGSAGVGGGGSGGTVAGTTCTDTSDCDAGEFCSVAKVCVPDGGCAVDDDCTGGNYCSSLGTCIPTGTCAAPGDCAEGETCDDATKTCVPGGGCGAEPFAIEAVVPNLFVSLDRSCSMNVKPAALPATKWKIAVDALVKMTTDFNGKIRWGLGMFPDIVTPSCQQAAAALPVADANESPLQTLLTNALQTSDPNFPDGPCVTNIDTAMQQASLEPAFADKTRPSYVLLITDGNQAGCSAAGGDAGTTQIITSLLANGVPTFVIGFGAGIDPNQMNIFADAGGVPNNDPTTRYYKADDQASLDAALATIGGKVASCSFTLQGTPPDPSKLYVFFDGVGVPRDPNHQSGWDYDPATNTITFYGQQCQDLKDGKIGKVDVVFGCNQPPLQ